MSTAKVIQIIANSTTSFDDAFKQGITDASRSVRGISGAKVIDWTLDVENNQITNYKVTLQIAFKVEADG